MRFPSIPIHFAGLFIAVTGQFAVAPSTMAVDAFVTAATGQPYGVASIEIPVEAPVVGRILPPIKVTDEEGRVFYPISDDIRVKVGPPSEQPVPPPGRGRLLNRVGGLIRELTSSKPEDLSQTVARRVSFLFVGSDPLRVRLADSLDEIGLYDIVPQRDEIGHAELVQQWWTGYTEAAERQIESADYPAWVETYLVAMLSGRVNQPLPDWYGSTQKQEDELLSTLKLIAGAEGPGEAAFRRIAAGDQGEPQIAALPLPPAPNWSPLFSQGNLTDVPVEPMATRVPPECFYIRYGSFENYLWFRDLSGEYGGDLSKMVTLRGVENDASSRVEKQLNLETTQLSRVLGPTVIEDQAIIGRDMFLGDGATIGILFKAKNVFLLRTSINGDRSKLASNDDTVTLKDIKIADRPVTFLSTSDNRVRSFMVEDGDYVLVTNSRTMAERFLEVADTGDSLAATSAFRLSRQLMPLERQDTIFAYFSPEMLRGLVSPGYLIELRRRLYAKADVAMVHLSRLAAAQDSAAESPPVGIDDLIDTGFLPTGFGRRADGSGVITVGDEVVDTMRGSRGTFLPIADVDIDAVTREESAWYANIANYYSQNFPTFDPIMLGIQRETLDGAPGIERITMHAEVAPWDPGKYGTIAQQLGPPTRVAMQFPPDDIIALQAHVASPQLGPPTHLFVGIKDTIPPQPENFDGIINIYRSLRQIPGYLGAWPQPGTLDRLPLGLGLGAPVGPGMSRLLGGLFRYTDGEFSLLSFQPEVIQASLPFLAAVDVDDTAQVRTRIGNLNGSRIEGWVNGQLYERARESSVAGANFLNLLSRQLKVEPEQVMSSAEQILGARLQCTLGGHYEFSPETDRWTSTAWRGDVAPPVAPHDYVAPVMKWFRGSTASLTQYNDRVVADAVIDIARQ